VINVSGSWEGAAGIELEGSIVEKSGIGVADFSMDETM